MGTSNERKDPKNPPRTVPTIERKSELKLLGVTFHENLCNGDTHFHNMINKANSSHSKGRVYDLISYLNYVRIYIRNLSMDMCLWW